MEAYVFSFQDFGYGTQEGSYRVLTPTMHSASDLGPSRKCLRGMFQPSSFSDSRISQGEQPSSPDGKETPHMHDFLVAGAFLMMVILPCIVTMGSSSSEEEGDEA
jgi:hypothetical protein